MSVIIQRELNEGKTFDELNQGETFVWASKANNLESNVAMKVSASQFVYLNCGSIRSVFAEGAKEGKVFKVDTKMLVRIRE